MIDGSIVALAVPDLEAAQPNTAICSAHRLASLGAARAGRNVLSCATLQIELLEPLGRRRR